MKKRIYILRQCLGDNIQMLREADGGVAPWKLAPVTVIDFFDVDRAPVACHEVEVHGPGKLVYDPEAPKAVPGHPLNLIAGGEAPLGTKVWYETEFPVTAHWWGEDPVLID